MQTLRKVFQGADNWRLASFGRMFVLIDAGAPVTVRLLQRSRVLYEATDVEPGFWTAPAEIFDEFEIISSVSQAVKIGISDSDKGGYNRVGGRIDAKLVQASSILDTAKVDIAAGGNLTPLVAANPARAALRIFNAGAKDVWLGGSSLNLVNACVKIAAGDLWIEEVGAGAAWYAIAAAADTSTLKIQELIN